MKVRNKGGRPTVEESQKRTHAINIRLNLQELVMLEMSAKSAGISNSEYARQAITNGKVEPRITPERMELIRKLCGMDNNINQIARQANSVGYVHIHRECLKLTDQIGEIINELRL
ncbi:MAG: plasmid mobilization relaxosome protein MobC [Rikenellaceae bacterium]